MRRLAALILSIILMLSVVTVYPSIEADAAENKETVVEFYVSANGKDREKGTDEPKAWYYKVVSTFICTHSSMQS